jgi:hypothetical protein
VVGEEVWDAESASINAQTFTELGDRVARTGLASDQA